MADSDSMSLSFHINFNDQCQAAFEFYAQVLNGQIGTMLQFKDSPAAASVAPQRQSKIVHANINIEGVEIAGADVEASQYTAPTGFFILLGFASELQVEAVFARLAQGGEVIMAPQQTFWSACYAIVIDRFGVPWKLNCGN
ncbi:MAG TPA: VOC family protein [Cellvibrionaceae bacterium]|nr:VOC family protein [Cellvibrionaceae bacterium]HMW71742.1 VOC family protein [Cellvibrionaceae bacterium]HNG61002.1 VOC family protein [Cellvibrionaceae bacterium]